MTNRNCNIILIFMRNLAVISICDKYLQSIKLILLELTYTKKFI